MREFNNRMGAQRRIVHLVNSGLKGKEELYGLSRQAINRWIIANGIGADSLLVSLIKSAASCLACLATKSQEQVSEDYRSLVQDIDAFAMKIEKSLADKSVD